MFVCLEKFEHCFMTFSTSHESKVMSSIRTAIIIYLAQKWEGFSCANHPSFHGFAILSVPYMHVANIKQRHLHATVLCKWVAQWHCFLIYIKLHCHFLLLNLKRHYVYRHSTAFFEAQLSIIFLSLWFLPLADDLCVTIQSNYIFLKESTCHIDTNLQK